MGKDDGGGEGGVREGDEGKDEEDEYGNDFDSVEKSKEGDLLEDVGHEG